MERQHPEQYRHERTLTGSLKHPLAACDKAAGTPYNQRNLNMEPALDYRAQS